MPGSQDQGALSILRRPSHRPQLLEVGGTHVDITQDAFERPDFERFVAMHRNRRASVAGLEKVVAAAIRTTA